VTKRRPAGVVVNGWTLFAHPLFIDQLETLAQEVEALRRRDPAGYTRRNATKRLAAIYRLALDIIPQDPTRPEYRQGQALGAEHTHWFRAKFYQQYRLFFRYQAKARVIIYAWVNDEDSRRAYGNATDAYRVFEKMLRSGNPPDSWDELLREVRDITQP